MPKSAEYINTAHYQEAKRQFDAYYAEKIMPELQKLEKTRKKFLFWFLFAALFAVAWLVIVLGHLGAGYPENRDIAGKYGVLGCIIVLLVCWPMFGYYRKSKESLLPLLAGFFGTFSYAYQNDISETLLEQSLLFKKYDRLATDDSFSGEYGGVAVSIAEYGLYRIRRQNDYEKTKYSYAKLSGGIIFCARMNKNFTGQTIVVKDRGWLNSFVSYKKAGNQKKEKLQRVSMESPEFEKAFETYSDNQVEARYILTAAMLEYMAELRKSFPAIRFSFFNAHLLVNIETSKNMFECSSFFRSLINKQRIDKNFAELYLLFSIVNTLRLNQKQFL